MTQRLREIPYNYTSFLRPGDRHPPARYRSLANPRRPAQRAGDRPIARMLYEVLGMYGSSSATPTCRTTCSPTATAAARWIEALRHRLDEVENARGERRRPGAQRQGGQPGDGGQGVDRFQAFFEDTYDLRKRVQHELVRHPQGQHLLRRPRRVSRHRRHRLARRVPLRGALPDTEEEMAPLVKSCIELGLTTSSRAGRHRLHRRRRAVDARSVVINTES